MIKINYECEETGQKIEIRIISAGKEKAKVEADFDPAIDGETIDPYGIIERLMQIIRP